MHTITNVFNVAVVEYLIREDAQNKSDPYGAEVGGGVKSPEPLKNNHLFFIKEKRRGKKY